ncbi:MAG: hypothetical protein IID36_01900, partial [Planctomycetes bacterium]|nr:hypothetical protein [Planctomycetota bacterium]
GRLGRTTAEHVDEDPNRDDPFASYKPDERVGIAGIERLAEQSLRGRRGRILEDRNGRTVGDVIPAQNGSDVSLTIHAELQRRLFDLLGDSVRDIADAPGGAIVVLDIATREVLALVSYPSYDPAAIGNAEAYGRLRDDTEALPLQFRAVANRYAPGSIVKPLVCWAGLVNNEISLDSVEHCTGYLFDDVRNRWRCWRISGTTMRKAHGDIKVVDALRGSCNVFMYRLGEKLGVERLCAMFDMAGIGRPSGIGLREEIRGINPTSGWLMTELGRSTTTAHSRLFAIGQGEIALTPLQAANLMAVYASGRYRPVTLLRGGSPTPEWTLPGDRDQLAAIRLGIYQVVNDIDGTAHKYSFFDNDLYALCGKTGSATTGRWPTAYDVPYVDKLGHGDVARIPATAKEPAIKRFISDHPDATFDRSEVVVASYWPRYELPPGERYSHAWFGGFLQRKDASGQPDWAVPPRVSFAVLVEFGGSGGRTAGPIARKVAALLLEVLGPDLDPDGTGPRGAGSNIARGYANPSSTRVSTDAPRDGTLSNLNAETPGDTDP